MFRYFVTVIAAFWLFAATVQAQTNSGGGGGFCASAPANLLAVLEGNWTLTQGPGVAVASGIVAIPFPPPPPISLNLEFLPGIGVGFLSGQGQQMIVLPALPGKMAGIMKYMPSANLKKYKNSGANCNLYTFPSIVGTNTYVLGGKFQGKVKFIDTGIVQLVYCAGGGSVGIGIAGVTVKKFTGKLSPTGNCSALNIPPGHMAMTIIVRFVSPNSGIGHVYFEGKQGGSVFTANAPITLSR